MFIPFPHFKDYVHTPSIPALYTNAYSYEQQLKELCKEYFKLVGFTDSIVDTINSQYKIIEEMQEQFPDLVLDDTRNYIDELVETGAFNEILEQAAAEFLEQKTAQITANTEAINTINSTTIPNVETRISEEAVAREEAISAEATAREEAISAEATAREEAISAEATAREEAEIGIKNTIYSNFSKSKIQEIPTIPDELEALGVTSFTRYPSFYWNDDKTEACVIGNLQWAGTSYPASAFNVTIPLNQQAKATGNSYQISNPATYFANVNAGRWEIGTTQFLVDENGWISIILTQIRKPSYDEDENWQYRIPFTGNIYLFDGVGR